MKITYQNNNEKIELENIKPGEVFIMEEDIGPFIKLKEISLAIHVDTWSITTLQPNRKCIILESELVIFTK